MTDSHVERDHESLFSHISILYEYKNSLVQDLTICLCVERQIIHYLYMPQIETENNDDCTSLAPTMHF